MCRAYRRLWESELAVPVCIQRLATANCWSARSSCSKHSLLLLIFSLRRGGSYWQLFVSGPFSQVLPAQLLQGGIMSARSSSQVSVICSCDGLSLGNAWAQEVGAGEARGGMVLCAAIRGGAAWRWQKGRGKLVVLTGWSLLHAYLAHVYVVWWDVITVWDGWDLCGGPMKNYKAEAALLPQLCHGPSAVNGRRTRAENEVH